MKSGGVVLLRVCIHFCARCEPPDCFSNCLNEMQKPIYLLLLILVLVQFTGCREETAVPVVKDLPVPSAVVSTEVGNSNKALLQEKEDGNPAQPPCPALSPAITAFLEKFDVLSAQGFMPTLRSGSTGIGYTLETMLEIEENNSPRGDFMGMELKAFRDDDIGLNDAEKMNLFLKEPKWTDGLKSAQRIAAYGYVDENGRTALYSTVTCKISSHHFQMIVDRSEPDEPVVWLEFKGQRIGFWTTKILEKRLLEKHSETAFVSAHTQGKGKQEQFHYFGVTWCAEPSIEKFLMLIEEGDVLLELRMHVKESGAARNHGSAFRIQQNRIRDLYRVVRQMRPSPIR